MRRGYQGMRCGLIGEHLGHSFSPQIHAAIADYPYELVELPPEGVGDFVRNGGFDAFAADCYLLEDDITNSYCYPALLEVEDGFLVSYYHSNNTNVCLNSTKITKVYFNEIERK